MAAQIDRLEIEIEAQAQKANKQLDTLAAKLSKVSSALSGINTKNLGKIGNIGNANSMTGSLQNLSNSMSRFASKTENARKSTRSLAASFGQFYASCFLLIRGFKALGKSISASMDYIETYNYYNVTMSKIASEFSQQWSRYGYDSAEAYGDSFVGRLNELTQKMSGYKVESDGVLSIAGGQNLSLDPEQLMNYQASVAAVTNSVGLVGETSVNAAKALSMLAADMSSLKNIDMSTVMTNFQSGLIGQSRALYKYGIDITNATLQTYAYKYGLETAVSEMTQADKMQLRLLAILNQSKIAWGDQANTINSVANQYRILKQQISNLARIIGNLFIPVLQAVLPVVNGVVMALQRMFTFIGNLLGVDWSSIMDGISGGYGGAGDIIGDLADDTDDVVDSTDGIGGSLDSANDKAKKLQKTILGFDEINKLNDNSAIDSGDKSGITGDDIGGIGAGTIDLSDEIAKALAEYESIWDKALKNSENKAQMYADKICAAFDQIRKLAKPTTAAIKKLWDEGLSKLGKFSSDTLKDFWNNFLKPVGTWMLADDAGLPRFFNITNDLLNEIDWGRLNESLSKFFTMMQKPTKFVWNGLMDFYEYFMKPMSVWTMSTAIPRLVDALTAFGNKIHWTEINTALKNFWQALAPFARNVGEGLVEFFENLLGVGADFINKVVPGGLNSLADALKNINPETAHKIGKGLGIMLTAIMGFKGISFIAGAIGAASPLVQGLGLLANHPYIIIAAGLMGIVAGLDAFGIIDVDWEKIWSGIKNIKDKIFEFLKNIDWDTLIAALGNFAKALPPIAEGFASMALDIINGLIGAFEWLSGVLADMKPETLEAIGKGLAAIVAVSVTANFVSNVLGLGRALKGLWGAVSVVKNGKTFGGMLTSAAGGFTSFASAVAPLVGVAGVITAIGIACERAFEGMLSWIEKLQGGNGLIEEFGGNMQSFIQTLSTRGDILPQAAEELFKLKESLESQNMSAEEAKSATEQVIDKLGEYGVTTEQAIQALDLLYGRQALSDEMMRILSESVKTLGNDTEDMASKIDLSAIDSSEAFAGLETAIKNIYNQMGLAPEAFSAMDTALYNQDGSAKNVDEAYRCLMQTLEDMGVNTNVAAQIIAEAIPGAVVEVEKSVDTHMPNVQQTISTSMKTAETNVKTSTGNMKKDANDNLSEVQRKTEDSFREVSETSDKDWSLSYDSVSGALSNMDTETKSVMKEVLITMQSYWKSVLINTNQIWEKASKKVSEELKQMLSISESTTRSISLAFSNLSSSISGSFSGLGNEIYRSIGDLYNIGYNAAQSFANGFRAVHIPIPQLYISSWNTHTLYNGGWFQTPNFSVNWYKNGGFFDDPTIIGVGDDGSEAVVPFERSPAMSKLAASIAKHMSGKELNTGRDLLISQREMQKAQASRMNNIHPFDIKDISNGVKEIIQDAVMEVAMAMNVGGDSNKSYVIHAELRTEDNEVLARAVEKGMLKRDTRLSPKPSF